MKESKEVKWWLEEDANAAKNAITVKKEQAKKSLEQDRYLKALRALVSEKGGKLNQNEWKEAFFENMEV